MANTALVSPMQQSYSEALALSQEAPQHIRKYTASRIPIPVPFLSSPESVELWTTYEKVLLSCLRTGDDKAAFMCLEKLIERFGATNERIMALRGLYQEAVAENDVALEKILKEYNGVLAENPTNTPIMKRRIALLRTLQRTSEAVDALVELLDASPTDIEAWAELAELYLSHRLFSQAEYCLEEVLLVAPNAWNVHARLGEVLYMSASSGNQSSHGRILSESMRRFCRSIELCDDYLRGYYGLKLTTDRLLNLLSKSAIGASSVMTTTHEDELPVPSEQTLNQLDEKATSRLSQIARLSNTGQYNQAEITAVKELLKKSTQAVTR